MTILTKLHDRVFRKSPLRVLRHRDYALYVTTDAVSNMGQWAFRVGTGWLAWDLTHSGFWLGMMALMSALPFFTFLPIAGAIADRSDRLGIIRATRTIGVALTVILAALTYAGWIEIYGLCALTFLVGVNQTFTQPVRMTMAPGLVPRDELAAAIGFSAGMQGAARFVGPALGGFMIAGLGVGSVFLLNAIAFMVSIVGLMNIQLEAEERSERKRGVLGDVAEGVRYAFTHKSIGPMLTLIFIVSITTRPLLELFPGFIDVIFHAGAEELGTLMSSVGIGAILGSVFVSNFNRSKRLVSVSFVLLIATGFLVIGFAATDRYDVALVLGTAIGFCITSWQATTNVLIQTAVDGRMRARVMSIYGLSFRACMSLGAMIAGSLSHFVGLQWPVAAGGIIALVTILIYLPKRKMLAEAFEASLTQAMGKKAPE